MSTAHETRSIVEDALTRGNGILRLEATWVARDSMPSGCRLGLKEEECEVGERGWISERWLASTTRADNRIGPPDEGLSYLALPGDARITLREAIEVAGASIMGEAYAQIHHGLGRLAKIFDYVDRIPFHLHQDQEHAALVGRNPKEEAYYFPEGVEMGAHPETFFGVHPSIVDGQEYDVLLPHLVEWKDDLILKHSRAYLQVPGEGFHLPAAVPHAPGTALTVELQEDSDVFAMLQARVGGEIIPKDLLFKDVRPQDRDRYGERVILSQVNWKVSGDPYFYENRHTSPQRIEESRQAGGEEFWIFYNSTKFSGKKLVVRPGERFTSVDRGVYSLLVWRGRGRYDGHEIEAGNFEMDELLVCHAKATEPILVENRGEQELVIFKFFGPDINPDAPLIPKYEPH
ncbi:MAG: hypothetical protein PVH11_00265 [Anaerolineae bacterium]|jgi:hypothetical protein